MSSRVHLQSLVQHSTTQHNTPHHTTTLPHWLQGLRLEPCYEGIHARLIAEHVNIHDSGSEASRLRKMPRPASHWSDPTQHDLRVRAQRLYAQVQRLTWYTVPLVQWRGEPRPSSWHTGCGRVPWLSPLRRALRSLPRLPRRVACCVATGVVLTTIRPVQRWVFTIRPRGIHPVTTQLAQHQAWAFHGFTSVRVGFHEALCCIRSIFVASAIVVGDWVRVGCRRQPGILPHICPTEPRTAIY